MAFLKVRNVKGKEDTIINTDLICRIAKSKNGYTVFFSSGNTGAAYYEYDEENAKRIFDAIGVEKYGELLVNDGMNRFGFGCHESGDEIMLDKYNVVTIYSRTLSKYNDFFEAHEINRVSQLVTAWDTFSDDTPGQAERYDYNGKSVYDLPDVLKDWGIYLAETRAE